MKYECMGSESKDKNISVEEYLDKIKPYLSDILNNYKTQGKRRIYLDNKIIESKTQSKWKTQLTMKINVILSKKDSDGSRTKHTKRKNIDIMTGSERDEIIAELFKSLRQRYKKRIRKINEMKSFYF